MRTAQRILRAMGVGAAALVIAATVIPANAGLVGYWRLDETAGTTASDSSGNANHGTLVDGPTWDPNGVFNGAIALDGLNDRIHVPDVPSLKYTGANLTLSAWVYLNAGENEGRVISKPWNWNGRYNYRIEVHGTPNMQVSLVLGNANPSAPKDWSISSPGYSGFTGAWRHLAATVDSSRNVRIYVDGNLAASGVHDITDWTGTDLNIPLVLGSLYPYGAGWGGNVNFSIDGKMDDAAIWNEALGTAKVRSLYTVVKNLGLPYNVSDMAALWSFFDAQSGGTIKGIPWQYLSSLPGSPNPGDAYIYNNIMYVALGGGAGLAAVPEPSSLLLASLGLGALVWCGYRRRRRP